MSIIKFMFVAVGSMEGNFIFANKMEKKRAPNFSTQEKHLLASLVVDFKEIIENKKTDTTTWREKDSAWEKITCIFNSQSPQGLPRSKEALRKLYDNMKKTIRKEVADDKKEIYKTGGGPPPTSTFVDDSSKKLILGAMNQKTVFGLEDFYGGDKTTSTEIKILSSAGETVDIDIEDDHNYFRTLDSQNNNQPQPSVSEEPPKEWNKVAAQSLKRPISEELQHTWTQRRRPKIHQPASELTEEYSSLAKIKLDFYRAEKEHLNIKKEREEILFKLEKRNLELQIEMRELQLKKLKSGIFVTDSL